jgi:hypothetical protein
MSGILSVLLLVLGGSLAVPGGEAGLEVVKGLVGEWEEVSSEGKLKGTIVSTYRLTAGGTAVLETVFPGTRHEMVTLYREEEGALVLTHYCTSGNQPSFRARRTAPNQVVYEMTGISSLDSPDEPHMRKGTVTWIGENEIETEWLEYRNDEVTYRAAYRLRRRH